MTKLIWLCFSSTKSVYRYRSLRSQQLLNELNQSRERLAEEASGAYSQFLKQVSDEYETFRDVIQKVGTIDCLFSLATVAMESGYVRPTLVDERILRIDKGRHPIVEKCRSGIPAFDWELLTDLSSPVRDDPFVPNSVEFRNGGLNTMVLTGCNMGGEGLDCAVDGLATKSDRFPHGHRKKFLQSDDSIDRDNGSSTNASLRVKRQNKH